MQRFTLDGIYADTTSEFFTSGLDIWELQEELTKIRLADIAWRENKQSADRAEVVLFHTLKISPYDQD